MPLLQEFLDQNQHRGYPLTDAASGRDVNDAFTISQSFMVDMNLNVPATSDMNGFFVSSILVRSMSIDVTVSYMKPDTSIITMGTFQDITIPSDLNAVYQMSVDKQPLQADSEMEASTGFLTVGRTDEAFDRPGYYEFTHSSAELLSSVVHGGLIGVKRILVDNDAFTGDVVLKEGDGVTMETAVDASTGKTIITISAAPDDSITLNNDTDVFNALVAYFGTPVTSVNSIKPDATGDFTLTGLDCTLLEGLPAGLSMKNPCSKPCCDKDYLDGAYQGLNELNQKCARLVAFYTEVRTSVNAMQNKLAMLQLNTNIER